MSGCICCLMGKDRKEYLESLEREFGKHFVDYKFRNMGGRIQRQFSYLDKSEEHKKYCETFKSMMQKVKQDERKCGCRN